MPELLKKSGELGLLGGAIPEEYGGAGLDKVSSTIIAEKLALCVVCGDAWRPCGDWNDTDCVFRDRRAEEKISAQDCHGELISCYCLSEPQAGSDALAARTRAVLSSDGKSWVLNGQKMWITNGGFADVFVVFAKVDGEKFSCFIVERGTKGFSTGAEEKKMGIKGSSTVPIFFENCAIPKENLLHEIGRGHIVAFNTLNAGRFSLGAYCLGGAKKVLEASAKYAKERVAFGKPIAEFGMIRSKLGEMAVQIFAIESMVYRTAGTVDEAMNATEGAEAAGAAGAAETKAQRAMRVLEEYAIESSICKVYCSEVVDYCVDEAVQIYGGYGFHEDYPVARAYRDSRINRIFEGTNEINRMLIVQMLIKRAMSGALPFFAAAKGLADEVMAGPSMGGSFGAVGDGDAGEFAEEEKVLESSKKIFLQAAGGAMQKFREKLAEEQEVVGALANIVMEVYAVESVLRRAQKAAAARGDAATSAMADATRAFIYGASDRVEKEARTALVATLEGDMLRTQLAVLKRFSKHEPVDIIALRRRVSDAVLAQDRYPFEGR